MLIQNLDRYDLISDQLVFIPRMGKMKIFKCIVGWSKRNTLIYPCTTQLAPLMINIAATYVPVTSAHFKRGESTNHQEGFSPRQVIRNV